MAVILIRWRRVLTYAVFVVLLIIGLIYRYSTTPPIELHVVSDATEDMSSIRTENVNNSVDAYRNVPNILRGQEQQQKVDMESRPNISYTELRDLLTPPITLSHQIPNQLITQNETNQPMQVIIVTKMRSGSSFTGELFNRNNDFVYYFEPLNEIPLDRHDRTASFMGVSRESILNNIVKCNFSNFKTFNWWTGRRPRQQCGYSNAYQAPPLCTSQIQRGKKVYAPKSVTDALKVAVNEATCRSRQHIAIKTVRISDIGLLKGVVTDPSLNVKIVHLVRDPRATSSSRQDIGDPDSPEVECTKMENNLNYWLNPPDWIRGRYMLLRYEDLAERPHYIVDAVYDFLNLTAPSTIGEWLDLNTKIDDTHTNKWSHTRQSNKTAHAWRTHPHIKFDKIQTVQHECANVMSLLGYKSVHSSAELRDPRVSTVNRYTYPLLPNRTGPIG